MVLDKKKLKVENHDHTLHRERLRRCGVAIVAEIDEPQQGGSVVCEWGKHPPGWCNHVVTTP